MAQLADATNEYGDVITSSPGLTPAMCMQRWRPAVPEETAAQWGAPTASASIDSKRGPVGPSESQPERSTSSTSSSSRSSIHGALRLIRSVAVDTRVSAARELRYGVEPLLPALTRATNGVEIRLLDRERDLTDADLVVVDRAQRRHFGSGAAHEHLVRQIEIRADDRLLDDRVAEVLCDLRDRVAGDTWENPGREIGRVDDAVTHDEDVLARAVGNSAFRREEDRLVVAGVRHLGHRKHRVDVDTRRLRDVRDDVRRDALPRRDLGADARAQALLAQVGRPGPAHDHGLDRVAARRDAELPVAVKRDRADVALRQPVGADQLVARRAQVVDRVRDVHVEQLRGVVQPLHVLPEPEDRGDLRSVVAEHDLEDARDVVQTVQG